MGIRFRFEDDSERKDLEDFVEKLMSDKLGGLVASKLLGKARGNRGWYALRTVYLAQGALIWVISLPVQAGMSTCFGSPAW